MYYSLQKKGRSSSFIRLRFLNHIARSIYLTKLLFFCFCTLLLTCNFIVDLYAQLDKVGTKWIPYLEWEVQNPTYSGNPYDLEATVAFDHIGSGEKRTTGMFYETDNTWKFRFSGTRIGSWTFTTSSSDPDLDGLSGTVTINPNPDVAGFVTNFGNKWGRLGTDEAFVPQFVMYDVPSRYYNNPDKIEADIRTFIVEHGFTGFHTGVYNRWFNLDQEKSDGINTPNPDRRTFEALELLITKVHAAGGVVHIWMWGDEARRKTPVKWGINGKEDKRLQRYLAARLGPIPGWTMGYGFDLSEWVNGLQLKEWHDYMQSHLGWKHYLGARADKNELNQKTEAIDYSSYEQHKPDYNKYVETIEKRPQKPSFSEDRFRVRGQGKWKDYSFKETRRGLWHSTMAGGVANIWGNLLNGGYYSRPYPNADELKTWSLFFKSRFLKELRRNNNITNGVCLQRSTNADYIIYIEDASSVQFNLSGMRGSQPAIAVDTKASYQELNLGILDPKSHTWDAPYNSDWAIAIGDFSIDETPPSDITGLTVVPVSDSKIDLSWQPASDSESGISRYNIYREGNRIDESSVSSFSDVDLDEKTTYSYEVSAVNGGGLESAKSLPVSATTLPDITPPDIAVVNAVNAAQVNVVFSEGVEKSSAENVSNYRIDPGVTISNTTLSGDSKIVQLTTTEHQDGVTYTLTLNSIRDLASNSNVIAPNTTKSYTYVAELRISNLAPGYYQVAKIREGDEYYIDRSFRMVTIPSEVTTVSWIKTANNDKFNQDDKFITFDVNQSVSVFVGYDIRATSVPDWLSEWSNTGLRLETTDVPLELYRKDFSANKILLGGNLGAPSMYLVLIKAANSSETDLAPPSAPTGITIRAN